MKKLLMVIVVISSIVFLSACASGAAEMELPQGYIKASDVVPAMGEHWMNPEDPTAPAYLIYEGEVIGIEYLWTEDIMQEVPGPLQPGGLVVGEMV